MMNPLTLNAFKQAIADFYDRRSPTYDQGQWRSQICDRLLEYAQLSPGQTVLDIGTGTGYLALAAAQIVGDQGQVLGIDISAGMLAQAHRKMEALGLNHVTLQQADAEAIDYASEQFDVILCAHTFPWLETKDLTLRLWYQWLKPGGIICVHTPADTAYVGPVTLRILLAKYGIALEPSNRIGSIDQCHHLFAQAGF